jgi:hypothetical protein
MCIIIKKKKIAQITVCFGKKKQQSKTHTHEKSIMYYSLLYIYMLQAGVAERAHSTIICDL